MGHRGAPPGRTLVTWVQLDPIGRCGAGAGRVWGVLGRLGKVPVHRRTKCPRKELDLPVLV